VGEDLNDGAAAAVPIALGDVALEFFTALD
jgi:hypothetical protein